MVVFGTDARGQGHSGTGVKVTWSCYLGYEDAAST